MNTHASFPQGQPTGLKQSFQPYPAAPMNPNGIFLGSAVSQNLSYTPIYQGFFPNHSGSQVGYQNPPSFMFRERKGRVNWRNIESLDVDELIGKGDIRMLESYLSNLAFANLEKEDIESFGDVNLLKLFRLSQYSLEYLLNCQNYLASQAQALDFQYRASEDQLNPLEEQAKRNQAEILNLKNEVNQKKDLVKAYQNSLNNPVYKCHLCPKLFKSQDFLNHHFQTRHGDVLAKSKKSPKAETAAQTQNNNNNQQETAQMIEKLMGQLKQNEDLKLSQLTSTLQDRLQEVIKSNKELTAKVAEMEKKMDLERESGAGSPDQPFNRTIRRENTGADPRESLQDLQSRQTPKKPSLHEVESPNRIGQAIERQTYNAGSLNDVEEQERQKRQAFNAGSLRDLEDDDGSVKNASVGTLKNINNKKAYPIQIFKAGELLDLEDSEKTPKAEVRQNEFKSKAQSFKAGSLHDLDDDEVRVKEKSKEELRANKENEAKDGIKKQSFYAGELQSELKVAKGINKYYAGDLEDDNDFVEARNRKRSQEDFVVMEQEDEDEEEVHGARGSHGKREGRDGRGSIEGKARDGKEIRDGREGKDNKDGRGSRASIDGKVKNGKEGRSEREVGDDRESVDGREVKNTEEVDEDEIREQHKNAVIKARNLIRNKYLHPITNEEFERAEKQVDQDLKTKCAKILKVDYDKLKNQSNDNLIDMGKTLKTYTQKDIAPLQKLENEYQTISNQVQPPVSNEKEDNNGQSKSKNKLAQSSELMNLVVNPDKTSKNLKDSAAAKKKQIFESQNLDSQLGSYEELKNRHAQAAKENGTNLMKKSIQGGVAEYL